VDVAWDRYAVMSRSYHTVLGIQPFHTKTCLPASLCQGTLGLGLAQRSGQPAKGTSLEGGFHLQTGDDGLTRV
jgi:hypothetical protein